jgi:HSP20 family protein
MRVRTYNANNIVRDFAGMTEALGRAWENSAYDYAQAGGHNGETAGRMRRLPLNAWIDGENFMLQAYLPGVNPEEVEITFEGEELTIRGAFPAVDEEREFIKRELYSGDFERRLAFNVPVEVDAIEAVFENGLLTLTVPKAEAVRPKQIKIQAK